MSKNAILVEQVLVPCIDTPNINGRTYTMAAVELPKYIAAFFC